MTVINSLKFPQQCLSPYRGAEVQRHSWWFNCLNDHQSLTKWEALQCDTLLFPWLISPLLCFCCFVFNRVLMRKLHVLSTVVSIACQWDHPKTSNFYCTVPLYHIFGNAGDVHAKISQLTRRRCCKCSTMQKGIWLWHYIEPTSTPSTEFLGDHW